MIAVCYGGPFDGQLWDRKVKQFAVPVHVPGPMVGYYEDVHGEWRWREGRDGFTGEITNESPMDSAPAPAAARAPRKRVKR